MVEIIRNKWSDDLEELLQCPICMIRPTGLIFQCVAGHHICEDCKMQLNVCPTCSQRWSVARNRLAENLCTKLNEIKLSLIDPEGEVNKLLIPDRVCASTQTDDIATEAGAPAKKAMDEHSGSYRCRIGNCNVTLFYEPMMKHLRSDHSSQFFELPQGEDNIFKNIWFFDFAEQMMFDRAFLVPGMGTFFLRISSDCFGNLSGFLLMLHNGYHSKQYTYQLEIECCREHNTCKTYTGEVCSCRTPVTVLTEKCLQIKRVDIQRMIEHTKGLTCTVLLGKKPQTDGKEALPRPNNQKKWKNKPNAGRQPPPTNRQNGQMPGTSNGRPPFVNRQQRPQTAPNAQVAQLGYRGQHAQQHGYQRQQGQQGHLGQQGQQGHLAQQDQQGQQGHQQQGFGAPIVDLRDRLLNMNMNHNPPTRTSSIPSLLHRDPRYI